MSETNQIRVYSAANDWQTIFAALAPHGFMRALDCAMLKKPRTMAGWAKALRGCVALQEPHAGFDYEMRPAARDFRVTVIRDGVVIFEGSAFRFSQQRWEY